MSDKENLVKSRLHHGSRSLDLTIPADVARTMRINPGDVFRLVVKEEGGMLTLQYERVYTARS